MRRTSKAAVAAALTVALVAVIAPEASAGGNTRGNWAGSHWHPRLSWEYRGSGWGREFKVTASDSKGLPLVYRCDNGSAGSVTAGGHDSWAAGRHEHGPVHCTIRPLTFAYRTLKTLGRILVVDSPLDHATVRFHAIINWGYGGPDEQHWHGAVRNGEPYWRFAGDHDGQWNTELYLAKDW